MTHKRKYWSITDEFPVSDSCGCYNKFERRSRRRFLDWPTKWMNRPIFSLCGRFKNKETTMSGDNKVKHFTWKCVSHCSGIIYLILGRCNLNNFFWISQTIYHFRTTMSSDGRSGGVSILGSHQMTLEVFDEFEHVNLVIVFERLCVQKKTYWRKMTQQISLFFYLIEKKISLKQKSNVPISPK